MRGSLNEHMNADETDATSQGKININIAKREKNIYSKIDRDM